MKIQVAADGSLQKDLRHIARIPIVDKMLDVIAQTTGMGFVGIARVTEKSWVACSVRDAIGFGLKPGDELVLESTICNEIRQHQEPVVIDHVAADSNWCGHHTPLQYGFQSYISFPILRRDGSFFGTLCAIDPAPRHLDTPTVTNMFALFAELLSFHLDALEELEQRSRELELTQAELEAFTHVAAHDLQEPLRKIRLFTGRVAVEEAGRLSETSRQDLERIGNSAQRMQKLVRALIEYPKLTAKVPSPERVPLADLLAQVRIDLQEDLASCDARLEVDCADSVTGAPAQWRQVFLHLLRNALQYRRPGLAPRIRISSSVATGAELAQDGLAPGLRYCHIRVADNGIGIPPEYREKIFGLFQRLHNNTEHDGYGLGLAIVDRILEQHGGLIRAAEAEAGGTVFHLYVPAV